MTVVEMYVDLIRKGIRTINDVPEMIRTQVKELLNDEQKS